MAPLPCPEGSQNIDHWQTIIGGHTYVLTENGQLQKEAPMSNTHIQNMETDRHRDATRAVHDELLQLALRRAEQHARQKETR